MSAEQALGAWIQHIGRRGTLPISWAISGPAIYEKAPFCPDDGPYPENFLSFYTWPVHSVSGTRLNFLHLPVEDELWEAGRNRGKAGFVQAALGWKPSPLQQTMDLEILVKSKSAFATY
ncbi:hypothetical protein [Arthrobacter sp. zg-Y1171]|uniref:hypothetical protein n=1 Tax=Arthrobacter sp. zg-Y1171 TaxID=2964610 RepID=UPI0021024860|nr:hypothetical protein [Arthrobacter sp. zg-Y1171]MCQ1994536.1 hypothetical protein [Arthrobacter sp. zg-Y1171]UWX81382.1 hypothetical protein N2L00_13415 [Arthrobacter sp. zg-Y1171]